MKLYNPENERIKRAYFAYLKDARQHGVQSVDAVAKALNRFETYTRFKPFKAFRIEQASGFKANLSEQLSRRTKTPLSKATIHSTLSALKAFFHWLAGQPGFRSRIAYADADYFTPSARDAAIAKAVRPERVPTIEQIRHVLATMPKMTDVEKRNRALIAFALLTGARDNAIASMLLKHLDLGCQMIDHDAREVRTKFSKSFPTYFFPVGEDIRGIVADWATFLRTERQWGLGDPLFPSTRIQNGGDGLFHATGLDRKCWSNATPIRTIFKDAFEGAGLPYFNPHSFRKTLVQLGQKTCSTPEAFKAWSQNLGHENVLTTLTSYGAVAQDRQGELIRAMAMPKADQNVELVEGIARLVRAHSMQALK